MVENKDRFSAQLQRLALNVASSSNNGHSPERYTRTSANRSNGFSASTGTVTGRISSRHPSPLVRSPIPSERIVSLDRYSDNNNNNGNNRSKSPYTSELI